MRATSLGGTGRARAPAAALQCAVAGAVWAHAVGGPPVEGGAALHDRAIACSCRSTSAGAEEHQQEGSGRWNHFETDSVA